MKETLHIYTRVSTDAQEDEGTSLGTQKDGGIEYAKKNKFKHQLWNEGAASSHDEYTNRPIITELIAAVDRGEIKHIYAYNIDRLSRNSLSSAIIADKLEQNEVTLHTPSGKKLLSDHTDKFTMDILRAVAVYDNAQRTARFRLGKLARLRQGKWKGGQPPFGYDLDDGLLVVNEGEAKWVREIYALYSERHTADGITQHLLANGVLTKRGKVIWSSGSVESVLRNTHYKGYWCYTDKKSGETIEVKCPRIVTQALANKVLKQRELRSYKRAKSASIPNTKKYDYVLDNLIHCGCCGERWSGNKEKTKGKYFCLSKRRKYRTTDTEFVECTYKRSLNIETVDRVVWDTVLDTLENSHIYKEHFKKSTLPTEEDSKKREARIKTLQKDKGRIKKIISDIDNAISTQEVSKVLAPKDALNIARTITALRKERDQQEVDLETVSLSIENDKKSDIWVDWVSRFGNSISNLRDSDLSDKDKNEFLKGVMYRIVVEEISIQEQKLTLYFNQPYYNDSLVWNDEKRKSAGYTLKNGKKTKGVTVERNSQKKTADR